MEALHGHEIAEAYVNTLGNISRDFAAAVILCKESVKIKIRKGVGQGGMMCPMLFTACLQMSTLGGELGTMRGRE